MRCPRVVMKYVVLLRGINVSGQRLIKMAELRSALIESGLLNVQTYLQSGNVVCESTAGKEKVREIVFQTILSRWGFEVDLLVLEENEFLEIREHPLLSDPERDAKFAHYTILFGKAEHYPDKCELPLGEGEDVEYGDGIVWVFCPNGYGRTKITNNFFEKKFGINGTTRNWKTVQALSEILNR